MSPRRGGRDASRYPAAVAYVTNLRRLDRIGVAAGFVIAAGVAIRLITYVLRYGLWQDETLLSLDIGVRSPAALMRPLDYDQTAPIGFLWGEWLVTRVAGMSVWALHALPLVAGIALVVATWFVGRRLVGREAALIATAMAAVSGLLLSYANLVKPYGSDALVTLALIGATVPVLRSPRSRVAWAWFAVTAILAPWFSTPSVLVLAAVTLAILTEVPVRSDPRVRRFFMMATAAWVAMAAALYRLIYAETASNAYLRRYWEFGFLQPGAPHYSERVRRAALAFVQPLGRGTLRSPEALLAIALAIAGLVVVARRRGRGTLTLLLAPYVAVVAAAIIGVYPIHSRLVLFLAPLLFFAAGSACAALAQLAPPSVRPVALAVILSVPPILQRSDLALLGHPTGNDGTLIMIEHVEWRRGDAPIYLVRNAVPGWIYYTTNWHAPDTARLNWIAHLISSGGPAFTAVAHRGRRVYDEGDAFCEIVNGSLELIGLGSGEEDIKFGLTTTDVDDGWADNEARRIAAIARPDVWVLANYTDEKELGPLRAALRARGATITWSGSRAPLGAAFLVRFDSPASGEAPRCDGPPSPRDVRVG